MNRVFNVLAVVAGFVLALAWASPAGAATAELAVVQSCLPDGAVQVSFTWRGNSPAALQQWFDLSTQDNGWQAGTFLSAGPLSAGQQTLTWSGLRANTPHFVRLNQLLANQTWDPSPAFSFTAATCEAGRVGGDTIVQGGTPGLGPVPPSGPRQRVLAPIVAVDLLPSGAGRYGVRVKAGLPNNCAQRDSLELTRTGRDLRLQVFNSMPVSPVACGEIYGYYDLEVDLSPELVSGLPHSLSVNGTVLYFTP